MSETIDVIAQPLLAYQTSIRRVAVHGPCSLERLHHTRRQLTGFLHAERELLSCCQAVTSLHKPR